MSDLSPSLLEMYSTLALNNRSSVNISKMCGCYHCLKLFKSKKVVEYTRSGTAMCPHCGVDSVLSDAQVTLTKDLLRAMSVHWFERELIDADFGSEVDHLIIASKSKFEIYVFSSNGDMTTFEKGALAARHFLGLEDSLKTFELLTVDEVYEQFDHDVYIKCLNTINDSQLPYPSGYVNHSISIEGL